MSRSLNFILCVSLLVLTLFICGSSQKEDNIKIASYNAGLVPGDNSHLDALVRVVPTDLDVILFQEVWLQSDANLLISKLRRNYPFNYYTPLDKGPSVKCQAVSVSLSNNFFTCLVMNQIASMGWDTIKPCLGALSVWMEKDYNCAVCFLASLTDGKNVTETSTKCFSSGSLYSYDGSAGLLVLSKKSIERPKFSHLPSFLLRRGLLEMCIDDLYIIGSHFPFNYTIPLQQDLQTDFIEDIIQKRPNIILGDLNTGLNYQPEGYELLKEYGYRSVNPNIATYCPTNSSVAGSCSTEAELAQKIDHIMFDTEIHENVLLWKQKTRYAIEVFGNRAPTVSDHIGIKTELQYNLKRKHLYCNCKKRR
ncbi:hypothetical protein ABK040_005052 [Willaertia magna]